MTDKLDLKSLDIVSENIEKIAALFPNCVTETANGKAIDFDLLKQELSQDIVEGNKERYRLEWPGKREAIVTANLPTTKTLRPVREDSVDFDNTQNIYIEGDNLEVLKLLQESYLGAIKMMYFDPPYNTGNDFVYKDNFTQNSGEFKEESGQIDEYNHRLVFNPETSGRYHSDWLTMMYPRLKLARNLLCDNGVMFISIGPDELSNTIKLVDEIFGEFNRVGIIGRVAKAGGNKGKFFSPNLEYIIVVAKDSKLAEGFRGEMDPELIKKVYTQIETQGIRTGKIYRSMGLYQSSLEARANQRYYIEAPDGELVIPPGSVFPALHKEGEKITPARKDDGVWRWTYDRFLKEKELGNIEFKRTKNQVLVNENGKPSDWNVNTKIWLENREEDGQLPNDFITNFENRHSAKELKNLGIPFDFAKPTELIKYLITICGVGENDVVLDFFSGSGTLANAIIQINSEDQIKRKFILVQLPESTDMDSEAFNLGFKNICEIGKERIRRVGKIINADWNSKKGKETTQLDFNKSKNINDKLDIGFRVFRLADSNMKDVYYRPQDFQQETLELFADNIKEDRTADDLLTQIMLDWGLPLSLSIKELKIAGKRVFKVAENSLMACFDNGINEAFAKEIAAHAPLRVVFKDASFADNSAKENVKQLLKQLSPNTEMKVI